MSTQLLDLADCNEVAEILLGRPSRSARLLLWLLALLLATAGAWAWVTRVDLVVRAPGRVRPVTCELHDLAGASGRKVSAAIGGAVVAAPVREGDRVRAGDVLVRLDTTKVAHEIARVERTLAADRAEAAQLVVLGGTMAEQEAAALEKAALEVAEAERGVEREVARRAREAERAAGELELARLASEEARAKEVQVAGLVAGRLEAEDKLRTARQERRAAEAREATAGRAAAVGDADVRLAEQRRATARAQATIVRKDFAARAAELEARAQAKRGAIAAAEEGLKSLVYERDAAVVRAAADGVVTEGSPRVGDWVEPGRAILTIAPDDGLRVDARVRAADVALLAVGMKARVRFEAYDDQEYGAADGEIDSISPDAEVVKGADGRAEGAFYLVRVRLAADEVGRGARRGAVKLGMTARVEVVTRQERVATLLVRRVREQVSLAGR